MYYTGALKAGLDCTGFLLYVICPVTIFVINNDLVFSSALLKVTSDCIRKFFFAAAGCFLWISGKKNRLFHRGWESRGRENCDQQI